MSKKYLIKFKPVDLFFFGQENKYRRRLENGKEKFEADYYQESAYFPQQTTILGALRYLLLQENGQIPVQDFSKAEKLIGKQSFTMSNSPLDFGVIKSLSPVFIVKKDKKDKNKDKFYIPNPKDMALKCDMVRIFSPRKIEVKTNRPNTLLVFDEYNEKEGIGKFLINMEDLDDFYNYTEDDVYSGKEKYLFEKVEKIGITKNKLKSENGKYKIDNKAGDEKAFYKQIFLTFKENDTSFGIVVELEEGHNLPSKTMVPLGAEKSLFEVSVEDYAEHTLEKLVKWKNYNGDLYKLVLLSDTYIEDNNPEDYLFSISETKPFRFLSTSIEKDNYGQLHRSPKRYNLFEAGSVFYFDDKNKAEKFGNKITGQKAENFDKIGYNKYIVIDKN